MAALAVFVLVGCGGDDGGAEAASTRRSTTTAERSTTTTEAATTTSTAPTTTTTAAPAPDSEEAVLAGYRAAWDGFMTAATANPPDPDFPALLNRWRDSALEGYRGVVVTLQENGLIVRGDIELRPTVTSLAGDRAVVDDCYIDNAEAIDPSTGEVVIPREGPLPVRFHLRREGEQWVIYDAISVESERGAMCG